MAYESVNQSWPEGTNDGRDLKPTPQEALAGAKRLYRIAMGKPWTGPVKITSGRNYTWPRRGVLLVNPDQRGGGWHEIVHSLSHLAARRLYNEAHGPRHAWVERQLIQAVVTKGWLNGSLKRKPSEPKPPVDLRQQKLASINAKLKRWQSKLKRSQNAIKKLERQRRHHERQLAA